MAKKSSAGGSSLAKRLMERSILKGATILSNSDLVMKADWIKTHVPILNVALSGRIDGGLTAGMTQISGESKHYKSSFALVMAKAFQTRFEEGIVLFYDNEFGTKKEYFESHGLDTDRIIHQPFFNIENLVNDITKQLDELQPDEKIMIVVDSIGNAASKKEVQNALEQNSATDMTRAKSLKSLGRIITPYLKQKDVPMVIINHTYKSQGFIPQDVVSGGQGLYLSSDTIFIVTRSQEKISGEVAGYNFKINIEKSRFCKEKSKFEVNVRWDSGLSPYSGLADLAVEFGIFQEEKIGKESAYEWNGHKIKAKDIVTSKCKEFWDEVFKQTDLTERINERFMITGSSSSQQESVDEIEEDE